MKRYFQHSVVLTLLLSYTVLGANGCFDILEGLYFGIIPHQLVQSKSTTPPAAKMYWTQYKHIPTIIKITVPSPATCKSPENIKIKNYSLFFYVEPKLHYLDPEAQFSSTRAPPSI